MNPAASGQICEIELVDGGIILGELISHDNGRYKVHSKSLGNLVVKESQIRSIRFSAQGTKNLAEKEPSAGPNKALSPQIESLQKSMMNDRDVMQNIMALQEDPRFQELLKDPEFMNAIHSGDIQTLMANPKFMELLNDPQIQQIQKKILKP